MEHFEQVMSFRDDVAMQKKWKAFVRKINTKTDDYSTVLKGINAFLIETFTAATQNNTFTKLWFAHDNNWIQGGN